MSCDILILGAMDVETDLLEKALENKTEKTVADYLFYEGTIGTKKIVVARTNVGMENAAAVTAIAMLKYSPALVISQGTSGAHNPELHQGDIVLGKRLINLAAFQSKHRGKGEGIQIADWELFDFEVYNDDNSPSVMELYSDETVMQKAKAVPYSGGKLFEGTVGSSDNWNQEIDRINLLNKKFGTDCEEMESYSIALICHHFKCPCFTARVISNSEHYPEEVYVRTIGHKSQEFILDLIKSL